MTAARDSHSADRDRSDNPEPAVEVAWPLTESPPPRPEGHHRPLIGRFFRAAASEAPRVPTAGEAPDPAAACEVDSAATVAYQGRVPDTLRADEADNTGGPVTDEAGQTGPAARSSEEPTAPGRATDGPLMPQHQRASAFLPEPLRLGRKALLTHDPGPFVPSRGWAAPDTVGDGGHADRGPVRAASVRGGAHRHYGEPRQDSVIIRRVDPGSAPHLILAVADGVGSAALSHVGSAAAVQAFAAAVAEGLPLPEDSAGRRHLLYQAAKLAADAVAREANDLGAAPESVATTLTTVVMRDETSAPVCVLNVGDSGIRVLTGGVWRSISEPNQEPEPEVEGGPTAALPVDVDRALYAEIDLADGELLLLGTDGILNLLRPGAHPEAYAAAWGGDTIPTVGQFIWQVDALVRSYDDDRSAICLWQRPKSQDKR